MIYLRRRVPATIRSAQRTGNRFVEVSHRTFFSNLHLVADRPGDARDDLRDALAGWAVGDEVTNPLYAPGADGTPAREPGLVFLAGIIGVPWQDIATPETITGRALRYIPAPQMYQPLDANGMPSGPNRWDVILGDPDTGRLPTDPFMIETIDQRPMGAANPIVTGETIRPPGGMRNAINGTEQNIVNRDDLQYACIFDLVPPTDCTTANADAAIKAARRVERVYRAAMAELLAVDDLREVMARRELYRRGARIADAVVEVAERILYSVVKEA